MTQVRQNRTLKSASGAARGAVAGSPAYNNDMRRVVITGPPPIQILDVVGPLEVFANASGYAIEIATPDDEYQLRTNRGFSLTNAIPLRELSGPIDTSDHLRRSGGRERGVRRLLCRLGEECGGTLQTCCVDLYRRLPPGGSGTFGRKTSRNSLGFLRPFGARVSEGRGLP